MNVYLTKATDVDKDFFFFLRNDPVTCRMSRRGEVTKEEHERWWDTTSDYRFVIVFQGKWAGYIRIGSDGTLSIAVTKDYRGAGIGTEALRQAVTLARELGFQRLFAEVAAENTASQKAFVKSGWSPVLFEVGT